MNELPLVNSGFDVLVFSPGDDPIPCLNKPMAFLTAVASSRQCTQPERLRNATWYKHKAMLAIAQEAGQVLDEEQLVFLADPGVPDEVPHSKTYLNDMENQSVHAMKDFEQPPVVDFTDNDIHCDSNIIPREKMIDFKMDDMIKEKLALKEQVDSLQQNLSNQIKEKECLLQTFTVFKSESKAKKDKYMEYERKEIVDIAAQKPAAKTIIPGIFKLDLVPLAPKLFQNREAHIHNLKYTQEQADIIREIVKQAKVKQPLDNALDYARLKCSTGNCELEPTGNKKNDMISQTPK
uniref:Uncharacterized protein n=1 Tax=Tanacetum cinerariifolium TaxID=118510 RepID=A0A699GTI3_TANCI|nr:hypothetical protein [Tanacetum cinerariifolium]